MTHVQCRYAWRNLVAVALAVALVGLVGCMMRPAGDAPEYAAPVVTAAPEQPCVVFGCEP
jgi:hypothetical protein